MDEIPFLTSFEKRAAGQILPGILAFIGGGLFIAQAVHFAHNQSVILDEGLYLYKGYLYISGRYSLFQDYGPWANHMPLSFLIPGYIQHLFGLGLRTGRYLSITLSGLLLLGLWLLGRRFAGSWGGTTAVWLMAANPALAKMYSVAKSQVLVACLILWILVLVVGKKRRQRSILVGSVLAGFMVMTRINFLPVLFLVILYSFWQHGSRAGILAAVFGLLPVVIGHALYWPGILKLWATWIPAGLTPFLDPWRLTGVQPPYWAPQASLWSRIVSFFQGIRFHFTSFAALFASLLMWPRKADWESQEARRATFLLMGVFISILALHAWASLGNNYCVFCFRSYIAYIAPVGYLILLASYRSWRKVSSRMQISLTYLVMLSMIAGVGFGAFEDIGDALLDLHPLPGSKRLGRLLAGRLDLSHRALRSLSSAGALFLCGGLIILMGYLIWRHMSRGRPALTKSLAGWQWRVFLGIGFLLSPSLILGGGYRVYDCAGDVIKGYETVGRFLAEHIPQDSLVYWQVYSPTLLLYIPEVKIFPAQLNEIHSFRTGGDPEVLEKYGFWNESLAESWREKADILLIQGRSSLSESGKLPSRYGSRRVVQTPPAEACREDTSIWIVYKDARWFHCGPDFPCRRKSLAAGQGCSHLP